MMNRRLTSSAYQRFISTSKAIVTSTIDVLLEQLYHYVDVPIQTVCCRCISFSSTFYYRHRSLIDISKHLTQLFVHSYFITFTLYFLLLLFAHLFSIALQRCYFLDPLLSSNRQCVNIQFVRVNLNGNLSNNTKLKENFLRENVIVGNESHSNERADYSQLHQLLDLLQDDHYMICQRSLYLYARFNSYTSLLHSNQTEYRFYISRYSSTFAIDRPPFLDLCLYAPNRSHLEQIQRRLLPLSSSYYSSTNVFRFDFPYTQVTLTLYELNKNSTHLERVSIHTGWLREMYSQIYFFKYDHALSTVLFDGLSMEQHSLDYFDYMNVPLPADPLLGLNEMVQQAILVLPSCLSNE